MVASNSIHTHIHYSLSHSNLEAILDLQPHSELRNLTRKALGVKPRSFLEDRGNRRIFLENRIE